MPPVAEHTGMVALVTLTADRGPHRSVRESAESVLARAAEHSELLDGLLAGLP